MAKFLVFHEDIRERGGLREHRVDEIVDHRLGVSVVIDYTDNVLAYDTNRKLFYFYKIKLKLIRKSLKKIIFDFNCLKNACQRSVYYTATCRRSR